MQLETVKNDITEVLFSRKQIEDRIAELAAQVNKDYAGKDLVVVSILKGGAFPLFQLIVDLDMHVQVDFMTVSSYGDSTQSSGNVKIVMDLATDIKGKDVLVVEDIVDTGLTLQKLVEYLQQKSPHSVSLMTLLRKGDAIKFPVDVKYVGFDIPNKFVVGYGFDYDQMYRNLDFIGVLDPKVYKDNGGRAEVLKRYRTNN